MVVEYTKGPTKGDLLIHGGSNVDQDFKKLFMALAGGPQAAFVCIPTAYADPMLGSSMINSFGFSNPVRLHTKPKLR
jgi:hypothetical protein